LNIERRGFGFTTKNTKGTKRHEGKKIEDRSQKSEVKRYRANIEHCTSNIEPKTLYGS